MKLNIHTFLIKSFLNASKVTYRKIVRIIIGRVVGDEKDFGYVSGRYVYFVQTFRLKEVVRKSEGQRFLGLLPV